MYLYMYVCVSYRKGLVHECRYLSIMTENARARVRKMLQDSAQGS